MSEGEFSELLNQLAASAEELKMLTMLSGHGDIRELCTEDLRALAINKAAISGLNLVGHSTTLPWWDNGRVGPSNN